MTLPAAALSSLPSIYQTLAIPTLINSTKGASASIFDFGIASPTGANLPSSEGLLGANATSSNLHLSMTVHTGDGLILGNMLYNLANTLNGGQSSSFLYLLDLL
jgi:hypothetical protein